MASNYTEHYELCQWEATDAVQRVEFNADNAKIDAALDALAGQVAEKADGDDLAALSETVAGHTTALNSKGNCRIVYGSYNGSGAYGSANPCTLTFDGKPLAVFVMAQSHNSNTWAAFLPMIRGVQWASAYSPCTVNWSENGVSWYHADSEHYQLSRGTNYYVALLKEDG